MPDIIHICYPGIGGQAAVATGLALEGSRAGVSHGIIFYGVEPTAEQYLTLCEENNIAHKTIVKKPGVGLGARQALSNAIQGMAPKMVISHHHDTAISAACSGMLKTSKVKPVNVFVEHHSNALKTQKDWVLGALAHRLTDHTVFLTEEYRKIVHARSEFLFKEDRTSVIGNGLELRLYPRRVISDFKYTVIGMQGRMDSGKDFESVIRAFALLSQSADYDFMVKPLRLELIGDGPDRTKLEALVQELKLTELVSFTGFLSHQSLIKKMQTWHAAVLMTEGETLSMAILEAWALQLPVISTRVSGVKELINDHFDGLLVEPGDSEELAKNLTLVLNNNATARRLGMSGRERVEQEFDRRKIWRSYLDLMNKLSTGSDSTPRGKAKKSHQLTSSYSP
ncbi:hypothetical protein NT6N_03490 [Oceaniferula spumae]|uniref:Glycosyl transferase family 1 domain-containing protein n=1 Tax=Oceaniferula spumae TaxID=2979115 RepID=A0AAT9FH64_9BACT